MRRFLCVGVPSTLIDQKRLNHKFILLFLFPFAIKAIHFTSRHFSADQKKEEEYTRQYLYSVRMNVVNTLPSYCHSSSLIYINVFKIFTFFSLSFFISFPFALATMTTTTHTMCWPHFGIFALI